MEAVAGAGGRVWCEDRKRRGGLVAESGGIFEHGNEFDARRQGIILLTERRDLLEVEGISHAGCKDEESVRMRTQLACVRYLAGFLTPSKVEKIAIRIVVEEETPRVVSARGFNDLPQYVSSRKVFGLDTNLLLNQEVIRCRAIAFNLDAACHREFARPLTERFFSGDWPDVQGNVRIQNRGLRAVGGRVSNGHEGSILKGEQFKPPRLGTLVVGLQDGIQRTRFILRTSQLKLRQGN